MTDDEETPPEPTGATYMYKPSVMGGMYQFRCAPDRLYWEVGRHSGSFRYDQIRRIRLSYRPVTLANYRFIAEIWAEGVPKLLVSSTSWKSMVEQQRQDAGYLAFMRELHANIAASGADPRLETGASPYAYWPGVVVIALLIAALPVTVYRTAREGAYAAATLIAGFLALCFWQMGAFFYRNRPGYYRADALPPHLLPRE